jgi:hypothetical protein
MLEKRAYRVVAMVGYNTLLPRMLCEHFLCSEIRNNYLELCDG